MKKEKLNNVFFTNITYGKTSISGNTQRKAEMYILKENNEIEFFGDIETAMDASCAYGISNYKAYRGQYFVGTKDNENLYVFRLVLPDTLANVEYHVTRTGTIIIDYIHDGKNKPIDYIINQ